MLEIELQDQLNKVEKTCKDSDLIFEFESSKFPIVATIRPSDECKNQMMMDLGDEKEGKNYVNGEIKFLFGDELNITVLNDFRIGDDLLNKIKTQIKKLHYIYLQMYFKTKMGM